MKPRVREVIVVEGRYDKNTLLQAVDAAVIETGGFAVFTDREKTAYLRRLEQTRGLILLTDPDGAGFVIRNRLKGAIPTGLVLHAYVPDVYGKERRKRRAGKEGKLGVEGMRPELLLDALIKCGATIDDLPPQRREQRISKADMFAKGLSGGQDSAARRKALLRRLELPEHMTAPCLLDYLNVMMTRDEFMALELDEK